MATLARSLDSPASDGTPTEGRRAAAQLSRYGLGQRFASVRADLNAAYDAAIGLSQEKAP